MPACLTHFQFARRVAETLPEGAIASQPDYYWGAQGPDFLFAHRYLPWMKNAYLKPYGNRLHDADPAREFAAAADFLDRHPDPAYRSYVYGLACHYALDSTAHPFIQARAEELAARRPAQNRSTMHGEIESALDAIILRRETGKLPSEVSLGKCYPKNEATQRRIAKLYRDLIFQVLGEDVSEKDLFQATQDAHFVFSLMTDRTGLKLRLMETLEKGKPHWVSSHLVPITEDGDEDYVNLAHDAWNWKGISGDQDFFELFDEAKDLAGALIAALEAGDRQQAAALTRGRTFSGETVGEENPEEMKK